MSNSSSGVASPECFDWTGVKFIVFDVDGTLYRQRPLRMRMAALLLRHSLSRLDTTTIRVLETYRRFREQLGDSETPDFDTHLLAATAARHGLGEDRVRSIVETWIERRPLPSLTACMYPGVASLITAIRRSGRTVGVLSDYPAAPKLDAMGLAVDVIVTAGDPEVGLLKPHPSGLQRSMALAGATPSETVMIGDRVERDGFAAQRADVRALILSRRRAAGWRTFSGFEDPLFDPLRG